MSIVCCTCLDRKQALADSVIDGLGEMDSMDIPSGRQAMIERVEGLMGRPTSEQRTEFEELPMSPDEITGLTPPPASVTTSRQQTLQQTFNPIDQLRQDTVSRLNDRLDQLQVYERENGKRTVVAVVDRIDQNTQSVVNQAVDKTQVGELELLDRETFNTIQRLIQAGVLQMSEQGAQVLYENQQKIEQRKQEQQRWLNEARQRLSHAERKRRMAGVLAAGGFPLEALTPLKEAVESTLSGLSYAVGETTKDQELVTLQMIEQRLLSEQLVSEQTSSYVAQLREDTGKDEKVAFNLYEHGVQILDYANEALDRYAMRA